MKQVIVNNISTSYFITQDGKCYNSITNKYLQGQINKNNGYLTYYITLPNGEKKRCYAHRMVAMAYLENPAGKKEINHIDGNKLNNNIDNLEWATPQENQQHALLLELRHYKHVYCFDKNCTLVAEYLNITDAARAAKISPSIIKQELHKDIKTLSGNFYWSYEQELNNNKIKNYNNTGKAKIVYQYDLNGKFITSYPSTGIAAKAIGGKHSHISECCRGKIKSYKNSIWRYADDIVSPFNES